MQLQSQGCPDHHTNTSCHTVKLILSNTFRTLGLLIKSSYRKTLLIALLFGEHTGRQVGR